MTRNAITPWPVTLPDESIKSGLRVRSDDWVRMGQQHNWLVGTGGQLVVGFCPNTTIAASTNKTFRFYVKPRLPHFWRLWHVYVAFPDNIFHSALQVKSALPAAPSAQEYQLNVSHASRFIWYEYDTGSLSEAEAEIALNLAVPSGENSVIVRNISCFEVPRVRLDADTVELGMDVDSLIDRAQIYGLTDGKSASGLIQATEKIGGKQTGNAKLRRNVFHWSVDDADALTTTSTSFAPLTTSAEPAALGMIHKASQTLKTYHVRVRAKVASGVTSGGTIRFTMTNGDSLDLTISNTSIAWTTSAHTLDVDAEDLTAADGRRSTRDDSCTIQWKTEATKTLTLSAISIYDPGDTS